MEDNKFQFDDVQKVAALNKHWTCHSLSLEAGQALANLNKHNYEAGLKVELAKDLNELGLNAFNLLSNPRFAVHHFLDRVAEYYAGDFIPISEDKQFIRDIRKIWSQLVSKGFFGTIWIAKGKNLLEQEKAAIEKQGQDWWQQEYYPESEYRLYIRETKKKKTHFRSIWTNVTNIDLDPKDAVLFTISGLDYFIGWYRILLDYLSGHSRVINLMMASTKHFKVDVNNQVSFKKEAELILNSTLPFLHQTGMGQGGKDAFNENIYEEFKGVPMESVAEALKQNEALRDAQAAWYGWFGKNLSEHSEAPNQADTFIDIKHVNNIQQSHLRKLQALVQDMKDKLGAPDDFDVVLNSNKPHEENEQFQEMTDFKGPNQEPDGKGTNQNSTRFKPSEK